MSIKRNAIDTSKLNAGARLPFELRLKDFELAMQDVYDFFYDVNTGLIRVERSIRTERATNGCACSYT